MRELERKYIMSIFKRLFKREEINLIGFPGLIWIPLYRDIAGESTFIQHATAYGLWNLRVFYDSNFLSSGVHGYGWRWSATQGVSRMASIDIFKNHHEAMVACEKYMKENYKI